MSAAGTRPPLFDPEPGSGNGPDRENAPQFPKKRGKGKPTKPGGESTNSPAWVRPFIFGGLILVALVSLTGLFRSGGDEPDPTVPTDQAQATSNVAAGEQDGGAQDPEPTTAAVAVPTPSAATAPAEADADDPTETEAVEPEAQTGTDGVAIAAGDGESNIDAFAVEFAYDYLNFDEEEPEAREAKLAAYLAPGLDPQLGWNGQGEQVAYLTTVIESEPTETGATVIVASHTSGPNQTRWIHLAVPVRVDDEGRMAVTATPAYVARPEPGQPVAPEVVVDDALSDQLRGIAEPFFRAYADRQLVQVDGVTDPASAISGLNGQLSLVSVGAIRVLDGDDQTREARVNVIWAQEGLPGEVGQTYTLTLIAAGSDWLIVDVSAS